MVGTELAQGWNARAQELLDKVLRPVQSDLVRLRVQLTTLVLLEPLCDVVFRPEIVDNKADPARKQNNNGADNFSNNRNRLLANVDDSQYGKHQTNDVDNRFHVLAIICDKIVKTSEKTKD